MTKDFNFHKLNKKHKKIFYAHQLILFLSLLIIVLLAIRLTNPQIVETSDKMSLTLGSIVGLIVLVLAFTNRLKKLLKVKFVALLIIWVILYSMNMIMGTLITALGLALIPLIIDDTIMSMYWNRIWYNEYDK